MWLFESSWWERWNFSENTHKTWGFWANVWQQEWSCHFLGFIVSVRPTLLSDKLTSPPEHDLCTQKWQRMTDHFLGISKEMAVTSAHSFRCAAQWNTYRSRLSRSICLTSSLHIVPTAAPELQLTQMCRFKNHSSQFWKILMLVIFGVVFGQLLYKAVKVIMLDLYS